LSLLTILLSRAFKLAPPTLIATLLAGCVSIEPASAPRHPYATVGDNNRYVPHEERRSPVLYGVVRSAQSVLVEQEQSGAGLVGGAAVGGLLGNKIGKGRGRKVATLLGAIAGGAAGSTIERNASARSADQIIVAFDDGSEITITQPQGQFLSLGDYVQVREINGYPYAARATRQ
jgi:outer membrane lipoprotein SlyB